MVTLTDPEDPSPTSAVILVEEFILKLAAGVLPKCTEVTLVKLAPLMVTVSPLLAEVGLKEVMEGDCIKVKPLFVAVPFEVVTLTEPEAPVPTIAEIREDEFTLKLWAGVPPKFTAVAPVKLLP